MTTLAADLPMHMMKGGIGSIPIIASDIVYEGQMIGDNGAGYGRPFTDGDKFVGHCLSSVTNAVATAGLKDIKIRTGRYRLIVLLTGVITDVGQPVYASDDSVYTFSGVYSYVGVITRYVDATHMEVEFRPGEQDEWGSRVRTVKTNDHTTTVADVGTVVYLSVDTKTITLLAVVAGHDFIIVNQAPFGTAEIDVDPDGSDLFIGGAGVSAGTDGYALINTQATQQRNDYLHVKYGGSTGWSIMGIRGTWLQDSA